MTRTPDGVPRWRAGWASFMDGRPRHLRGPCFEDGWESAADHVGSGHLAYELSDLWRRCALASRAECVRGCGFVYVMVADGTPFLKIGRTNDLRARMLGVQTHCPHRVSLVGFARTGSATSRVESYLHDVFRFAHERGEWFAAYPSDVLGVLWGAPPAPLRCLDLDIEPSSESEYLTPLNSGGRGRFDGWTTREGEDARLRYLRRLCPSSLRLVAIEVAMGLEVE